MFNNYPQPSNYIPNNKKRDLYIEDFKIYPGGQCSHKIVIDNYEEGDTVKVLYRQGLCMVVEVEPEVLEDNYGTKYLLSTLNPEDSSLFNIRNTDNYLQYKITREVDGEEISIYSDTFRVKICSTLDESY